MLIHIAPCCFSHWVHDIDLVSAEIPELSMVLRGGKELRTGYPYPNRKYQVASPAAERAIKDGFLIETETPIKHFSVISRWAVNCEKEVKNHFYFEILDNEFGATSTDATLWYGHYNTSWTSRWPDCVPDNLSPMQIRPVLKLDENGDAIVGQQRYLIPSLERDRVLQQAGAHYRGNRTPSERHAFRQITTPPLNSGCEARKTVAKKTKASKNVTP